MYRLIVPTTVADLSTVPDIHTTFTRQGYFVARGLLAADEVTLIRDTFMAEARNGPVPGLSEMLPNANPADPLAFYPRMMHPHCHPDRPVGPLAERYLLDPRIQSILHACMDETPIAVQSMFYFKPPGARGQSLHQDNYYLRVKPKTCCAAWIAVDAADEDNGGMTVVPGTQNMEVICPDRADPAISFTQDLVRLPPGLSPVPVNLAAGDVLFFNGSLVHGSTPNTSPTRYRRSLIFHYVPESTTEMSHWYHGAIRTFDHRPASIAVAQGGGPCGEATSRH